jgi:hypothetical protein
MCHYNECVITKNDIAKLFPYCVFFLFLSARRVYLLLCFSPHTASGAGRVEAKAAC